MPQTFYAAERDIFAAPEKTERGYKMGFRVATADEYCEEAAEEIAKALNLKSKLEERFKALDITCAEAIYQTDRVQIEATTILEEIANIIGYNKDEE